MDINFNNLFWIIIIAAGSFSIIYIFYYIIKQEIKGIIRKKKESEDRRQRLKKQQEILDQLHRDNMKTYDDIIEQIQRSMDRMAEISRLQRLRMQRQAELQNEIYSHMRIIGINKIPFTLIDLDKKKRELSLKYHPDRNGGKDDMMKKVNVAYDFLKQYASGGESYG